MLAHLYIEEQDQDNWSVYDYYVRSERNATEFARFIGWVEGGGVAALKPRVGPCFSLSACRS